MNCSIELNYGGIKKTVTAQAGESLYAVLSENGVPFAAPCGGNGRCGKCRVRVSGNIHADADGTCLACKTIVEGGCAVYIGEKDATVLTSGQKAAYETDGEEKPVLAVDIGTTTIAAYLMDGRSGTELGQFSALNPQRVHGADVISRMEYANKSRENALLMQQEIDDCITEGLKKLLDGSGRDASEIERMYVGNTVMMHIAAGYNAESLARAPFVPFYTNAHRRNLNGSAIRFGGCISGYVGADTVAASLACDIDKTEKTTLLIDIGTNGEIVLKHNDKMFCCSCAAGPAFEGAHIACGSGAVTGAIDHVFRNEDGSYGYSSIGNVEPVSLCGSALVDVVALIVEDELISPSGRMKERVYISKNVYIDPADIREVQLAKAAIAAGIEILLTNAGIEAEDVEEVLIAGGFGNYIRVSSACTIGMLPRAFESCVRTVGNAAGDGGKQQALSRSCRVRADRLRSQIKYIELSSQEDFEDIFTEKLLFEEED